MTMANNNNSNIYLFIYYYTLGRYISEGFEKKNWKNYQIGIR